MWKHSHESWVNWSFAWPLCRIWFRWVYSHVTPCEARTAEGFSRASPQAEGRLHAGAHSARVRKGGAGLEAKGRLWPQPLDNLTQVIRPLYQFCFSRQLRQSFWDFGFLTSPKILSRTHGNTFLGPSSGCLVVVLGRGFHQVAWIMVKWLSAYRGLQKVSFSTPYTRTRTTKRWRSLELLALAVSLLNESRTSRGIVISAARVGDPKS